MNSDSFGPFNESNTIESSNPKISMPASIKTPKTRIGALWLSQLYRLAFSIGWLISCSLSMAIIQIRGDSLMAEKILNSKTQAGTPFSPIIDQVFINVPTIPDNSYFNPDIMLHSFIIISVIAAFVHFPWIQLVARIRRFFLLWGFGYFLRMLCLAGTVLPPSNPKCELKTHTLMDSLIMAPLFFIGKAKSCTDKIFSGHTLTAMLLVCFWLDARITAGKSPLSILSIYPPIHALAMMISSVINRCHYTVDITLAVIITIGIFTVYKFLIALDLCRRNGLGVPNISNALKIPTNNTQDDILFNKYLSIEMAGILCCFTSFIGWIDGVDIEGRKLPSSNCDDPMEQV